MSMSLIQIYHLLPSPVRSGVASLRGLYLRAWRYGPETEALVQQALEREHWSAGKWNQWQQERLAYVLHRAATKVPYYRDYWADLRRSGSRISPQYLENWPILDKERVRQDPLAFVADDRDVRNMFHEHTSGTTGKPLQLFWSKEAVRGFYALFEARWRRWYGVSRADRWAILGGQLVTGVNQNKPPFWVWNASMNQLYMSSYHLSTKFIRYYLDALQHYRVKYIFGYPSALSALAHEILRLGRRDLQLQVAITNAEPVFDHQRQVIGRAFNCSVRETYGNAEIVTSASECASQNLHLWPELGYVEVCRNGEGGIYETPGDLIGTSLLNYDMPLIRYRLGDEAILALSNSNCQCGRSLPIVKSIEGRSDDLLYTIDGRSIGRLDPVFKAQIPLREAQIIQETLRKARVRYVPAAGFDSTARDSIISRVRERLGPVEVVLEELAEIPREQNGKFKAVKCNLPPEERILK